MLLQLLAETFLGLIGVSGYETMLLRGIENPLIWGVDVETHTALTTRKIRQAVRFGTPTIWETRAAAVEGRARLHRRRHQYL